ncbi:BZ3500_MvSof-1268-A1-R1_Chr4-3g07402 [Microbotryum saponariae]|uniref:BZ3500_MvSof-1268-A1-R1_Chr4-3g07402 protein n=1 Tax=Microbotryum saponariae TaxID=289078 RepID=A0A2X0MCV5_9BASI|nr:BZ3500_MvSof-1268-A1-R1_Chr4-3g07402 [Microbotryum saponariae]SDA07065.1 BZ3501_MvSof-1269-A2-R1_Chr4-2g07111 [Microbotryum saponariae]
MKSPSSSSSASLSASTFLLLALVLPTVLALPAIPRSRSNPTRASATARAHASATPKPTRASSKDSAASPLWVKLNANFYIPGQERKASNSTTTTAPSASIPTTSPVVERREVAMDEFDDELHYYSYDKRCDCTKTVTKVVDRAAKTTAKAKTTKKATTTKKKTTTTKKKTTTTKATATTRPATTMASNKGLGDGQTFWKQKTTFGSMESFATDVVKKWVWGYPSNVKIVQGVPASKWTGGKQLDSSSALQVAYPKGSRNPSKYPIGGVGLYSEKLDLSQASNVSFSYSVFFEKGFEFNKGGKLPGLFGGKSACSGGSSAQDCFSTRLMFRTGGKGEVSLDSDACSLEVSAIDWVFPTPWHAQLYLYAPREKQVSALCNLKPLSFCNSYYGMSIGRGSWTFKTGEWTDIRQDIWLNTPGKANGGFNIWVNGKIVLTSSQVYYRNSAVGNVATNGTASNMTLIDYDALPAGTQIPNGGFSTSGNGTFQAPTGVVKVIGAHPTGANGLPLLHTPRPNPNDAWLRKRGADRHNAEPTRAPQMIVRPGGQRARALAQKRDAAKLERLALEKRVYELEQVASDIEMGAPSTEAARIDAEYFAERNRREEESNLSKRAAKVTLPTGFIGIMFNTFFGGSDSTWNSAKLQYSYFNGLRLDINS